MPWRPLCLFTLMLCTRAANRLNTRQTAASPPILQVCDRGYAGFPRRHLSGNTVNRDNPLALSK